jgi:hypothetical protein
MRHRTWAWVMIAGTPLAVAAGDTNAPPAEPAAMEPGLFEFLAEESGVDEEMSAALMTSDLDRALERSAERRKVDDDGKDQ